MATLRIGALSAHTGVPASTLRYWEDQGLLLPDSRVGGQRRYGDKAVHHVARILAYQAAGCTLEEIAVLLGERDTPAWRELAQAKLPRLMGLASCVQALQDDLESGLRGQHDAPSAVRAAGSWRSW